MTIQEHEIIQRDLAGKHIDNVNKILKIKDCKTLQSIYEQIYVDPKLIDYAVALVAASRENKQKSESGNEWIEYGASPRASINLIRAGRAQAFLSKRAFVKPEDIRQVAHRILRHRIILTYEAEAEGMNTDFIVDSLLRKVEVP